MKRKASVLTFTVVLVVLLLLVASVPSLKADTGEPQLLWEKTYGAVVGNAVVQTSDGGYAVAGYSAVPSIGGSYANRTFLLVKTEAVGTLQWRKTYGVEGEFDSIAYSVIQTNDGGYALAGIRWTINNLFFWFVKTDSEGKMEWNRTYAGPVLNGFCVVIQTHDEGYALAGWTSNSSGRFLNLIKINQVGDVEWDKSYEGEQYDAIYAILEISCLLNLICWAIYSGTKPMAEQWLNKLIP
jgi:hypothetical protein